MIPLNKWIKAQDFKKYGSIKELNTQILQGINEGKFQLLVKNTVEYKVKEIKKTFKL